LVAGGVGVALLPANAQNIQRSGVVYKSIQEQFLTLQMAVVWRRDDYESSAILHEFVNIVLTVTQTS
jgi:DNA-binding transcriptional LysR family regulator